MNEPTARKRPIWVWIISIFYIVSAVWGIISTLLMASGAIPVPSLPPEQAAIVGDITNADHFFSIITSSLSLAAGITLLLLKRSAFYLFVISLGISIAIYIHLLLTNEKFAALGIGLIGPVFSWLILLAICIYTWRLKQKGVLR